jgi:hypothetical protein
MNSIKFRITALLLTAAVITIPTACQSPSPAQFEVISLKIEPSEVNGGETINVIAKITNIGSTRGIYNAALGIDGETYATKAVEVEPRSTKTITFPVVKKTAGTYLVRIGEMVSRFTVTTQVTAKEMELKHDTDNAREYIPMSKPGTGFFVSFEPPSPPFIIKKVRVNGLVYGSPGFHIGDSQLQVWDKDKKVIYTTEFPGEKFPLRTRLGANTDSTGVWADIELPDIEVNDSFYINIYTGIDAGQGFRMGIEDILNNVHSDVSVRGDDGIDRLAANWPFPVNKWYGDKNRVNWMVRVIGDVMPK